MIWDAVTKNVERITVWTRPILDKKMRTMIILEMHGERSKLQSYSLWAYVTSIF